MKKRIITILTVLCLCMLWLPHGQAEALSRDGLWSYSITDHKITNYHGTEEHLKIPGTIDGHPMQRIGGGVFAGNTSLKTVDLGGSINEIGSNAFSGCTNLVSIKSSSNFVRVGDRAFKNCTSLETIDMKISGRSVQEHTVLGYNTFENCVSLKEFTIPDGIKIIKGQAFMGCTGLKTIYLHKNILELGDGVFYGCTNIDGIWVPEDSPRFSNDKRGVLFNKDKTELLAAPGGIKGTYVVPETVNTMARYAFAGCDKLETILIPDTVTYMGMESFENCTALQTVVLSGHRETTHGQFRGCTALETIVLNRACSNDNFENCTALKSIYCISGRTDHAPNAFKNVTANMYYMKSKAGLSMEELQPYQFSGSLTWVPLDSYCVAKGDNSTYSVGSDIGAVFLMMADWDKLSGISVDGNALTNEQYLSMTRGTSIILKDAYLNTLTLGKHTLEVQYTDGSCRATFTLIEQCKHNIIRQPVMVPTCTKSGLTEGSYCSKCKEVFAQQETIKALDHDYAVTTVVPTCTEVGYDLHRCTRCSQTNQENQTAALGHHFGDWQIVKAPTAEESGLQARQCKTCGETEQKQIDTLTPPPSEPDTTQPPTTEPPVTEPSTESEITAPTQPNSTKPSETEPPPTKPSEQSTTKQPNLIPWIIVGSVLLVATAATALYLLRTKN